MSTNANKPLFSMRIFSVEWTMERPVPSLDVTWSKFTSSPCRQVPVLHVFGTTPRGQKTCAHVHNAFPYLFVSVPTSVTWSSALVNNPQASNVYLRQLQVSIDRAMALSKQQQNSAQQPGATTSAPRAPLMSESVIYSALLVRGKQFYGFTPHEHLFIKLFLYNPMELNRLVLLLRSGAIMQTQFSVYEAHIPYHLQFLADNNLFGMDWLHFSAAKFRSLPDTRHVQWNDTELAYHVPLIDQGLTSGNIERGMSMRVWTSEHVTESERVISPAGKLARCELEIDVDVDDILNRQARDQSSDHTTSESRVSSDQKIIQSLTYIWEEERRRGVKQEEVSPVLDQGTDSHPATRGVAVDLAASYSAHSSTSPAGFHAKIIGEIRALIESERTWLHTHAEHNLFAGSQAPLSTPPVSSRALAQDDEALGQGVTVEALVDEQLVLSQSSDKEVNDILNWMLDDELMDDEDEEGAKLREDEELEDDERHVDKEHVTDDDTYQPDVGDIIASQQILYRAESELETRDALSASNSSHVTDLRAHDMNLEREVMEIEDIASHSRELIARELAPETEVPNHVPGAPPISDEVSMRDVECPQESVSFNKEILQPSHGPALSEVKSEVPKVTGVSEVKPRQVQFNTTVTVYNYPRAQSRDLVVLDTPPASPTRDECEVHEPPRKKLKIDHPAELLATSRDKSGASSQALEHVISQSDVKLKISSLQMWSPLSSAKPRASQVSNVVIKDEVPHDSTVSSPTRVKSDVPQDQGGSVNASTSADQLDLSPELISGHVTSQHWTLTYHVPPPTTRELVRAAINQGQPVMHYLDQTRDHVTSTKFPTRTPQHVLDSTTTVTRDSYCLTPVQLPPSPAALIAKYSKIADIEDLGQKSREVTAVKLDNIKQASQVSSAFYL
jgi:hypothetical protein